MHLTVREVVLHDLLVLAFDHLADALDHEDDGEHFLQLVSEVEVLGARQKRPLILLEDIRECP